MAVEGYDGITCRKCAERLWIYNIMHFFVFKSDFFNDEKMNKNSLTCFTYTALFFKKLAKMCLEIGE